MRTLVLAVAVVILAVFFSALTASAAVAPVTPAAISHLTVTVLERTPVNATAPVFVPPRISLTQVPVNLTIVFENNETSGGPSANLTIANATGVAKVFTGTLAPGANSSVTFTVEAMDNITYKGASFVPQRTANGTIVFFDGAHPTTVGEIALIGAGPVPTLYITVLGEQAGTSYQFTPPVIIIPEVPITLNLTFVNNQSASTPIAHTFTINDNSGNPVINTGYVNPQQSVNFEFTINSMTSVTYEGKTFTPGPPPSGTDNGTIQFYCIPHVTFGMKGSIILGSAVPQATAGQNGVFLRAYWIGMIGIGAMIVWIGISYFVIKSSSPHFRDHREHVRKGLP